MGGLRRGGAGGAGKEGCENEGGRETSELGLAKF